jgi:hypothetical protein
MDGWNGMDGMDGWMGGWTGGWMDGWVCGWMDGSMDGWVDGWVGGWMDGWVGRWMDGWMCLHDKESLAAIHRLINKDLVPAYMFRNFPENYHVKKPKHVPSNDNGCSFNN